MSRAIRLTRLHAINWYGYKDSFDVAGNLLVAGVTGSGKSVLMDLLQFVLIANQQKVRYNLSATGDRSTRDLRGYCLGDTKQDIDGVPQYMRDAGVTYVGLEFTWPGNKKRVETWGLRIEFANAQSAPSIKPFFIPASFGRDDFLDDEKFPLELGAFKQKAQDYVDPHGNTGRLFNTLDEFRREMALPTHLNFDRPTLDYLLPAAMSFTFMDSFSDFCRRYILPAETVDIQNVKDSYLVFRNLQAELAELRDQQQRLERIHELESQRLAADRDRIACRYLEAELRRDHAREEHSSAAKKLAQLEEELAAETARMAELEREIEKAKETVRGIEAAFNASEDGKLFRHILKENQELVAMIERLKQIGRTVEEARDLRVRNTSRWLESVSKLPFQVDLLALKNLDGARARLAEARPADFKRLTLDLSGAAGAALKAATEAAHPLVSRHAELERQIGNLNANLTALRSGTLVENTVLLGDLNRRLPRRGSELPAQALWQLCEVADETWRPAIEVAFHRKFAVVVREEDYDQAERIYHELKQEARGESLVNPVQALTLKRQALPNSLAEKIETDHPVARAIVDQLYGDVLCVDDLRQLRDLPAGTRGITRDGFMAQRPFVERRRHYDNRPCIGQRGIEKQRAFLQSEMDDRRAEQRQLAPALDQWRQAQNFFGEAYLDSQSLHDDLAEAARLPEFEEKFERNREQLKLIRSDDLQEKENELRRMQEGLRALETEWKTASASPKRHILRDLRGKLEMFNREVTAREERFREVAASEDVSPHLPRLDELRAQLLAEFPSVDAAADRFHDLHADARTQAEVARRDLVAERRTLISHPQYGNKYSDFDPEASTNTAYDERLKRIREAQIAEYERKAAEEERNWQELFRTQALEKLRERLMMVEDLMALLKTALDKPIGNNRYTIKATPNRDGEFEMYRKLLDLSAIATEGGLFANASTELREAVERLFKSLTGEAPSKEADAFIDYRNYFDYDILVTNERDPEARPYSINRQSGKSSGGENQTPYFVAILASYLRAYRRHEQRRREPSLAIVPIDEAFSKLSGERIRDCISALKQLDLQGVFSMSTGNIPYAIDHCDQVIAVHKQEKTLGRKTRIRNVAASLTRVEARERLGGKAR